MLKKVSPDVAERKEPSASYVAPEQERAPAGRGLVLVAAPCCRAGRSHSTEGFVVSHRGRSAVPPKAPTLHCAISNMLAEKWSSHSDQGVFCTRGH